MQCDRAGELIGAYFDQELDAEARREVGAHLSKCVACWAFADDLRQISRRLAVMREPAPERLLDDVRRGIAGAESAAAPLSRKVQHRRWSSWLRQAAALVLAGAVTAAATAIVMSRMTDTALVEREIAAARYSRGALPPMGTPPLSGP